jgi:ubiquinone/menaquinone biosynthesis C-methylase UbiE
VNAYWDPAEYFGQHAARYDSGYDRLDSDGQVVRSRMATVLELVGQGPGSALDAGMGSGRLCAELDSRSWTVSGIDAAPEMVAATRSRLPHAGDRLLCANVESVPFPDASFDVVCATGILEYADVEQVLAEFSRLLRPHGRAIISYPNPAAPYVLWKTRVWYLAVDVAKKALHQPERQRPRGTGAIQLGRLVGMLDSAGFQVQTLRHAGALLLLPPLDIIFPRAAARLGARLDRSAKARGVLATQLVYVARKRC